MTLRLARTTGSLVRTRDRQDRRYSSVPVEVDPDVAEVYERFLRGGSLDLYGDEAALASDEGSTLVPSGAVCRHAK